LAAKTYAVEVARRQPTGDRFVSPLIKERAVEERARGAGWLFFAGIMIFIAGVLNCVWGIAAIDDARFFVEDQRFILSDLDAWGWITLLIGVIPAVSIWTGGEFGRWVGIFGASISAIGALLAMPAFPLWSLAIFGVDVLIIYGLVTYGGHRSRVS
jgi:hypothetical protein